MLTHVTIHKESIIIKNVREWDTLIEYLSLFNTKTTPKQSLIYVRKRNKARKDGSGARK